MSGPVLTYGDDFAPAPPFHDLDSVRVTCDVVTSEGERYVAGSVGTIVTTWADGAAYDVEFDGDHLSLATVRVDDLEHVPAED